LPVQQSTKVELVRNMKTAKTLGLRSRSICSALPTRWVAVLAAGGRICHYRGALAAGSAALRRYADVLAPLYQSFDETRKRRFDILSRAERRRFFGLFGGVDRGEFIFRRGELRVPLRKFPT
jgi:hypothetical protein